MEKKINYEQPNGWLWIIILAALMILMIGLNSCNISNKALKKRQWIERKSPTTLLDYCAKFDHTDSIKISHKDTVIKNYVTLSHDTLIKMAKNVNNPLKYIKIPCPLVKATTNTITHYVTNDAACKSLKIKYDKMQNEYNEDKGKLSSSRHLNLILGGIILLFILLRFAVDKFKWL